MAIAPGHRFPITFDELFPQGFFVLKVERAKEFAEGKAPRDAVDKLSGLPVWTVQGTDPSARGKNTGMVVKIASEYQPVPPEVLPGTPFRPAVFVGLKVSPYVRDGWVNYTVWADEMVSPQDAARSRKSPSKSDSTAGAPPAAA
ncbi:hypothetical protein [Actinosynnema mirum]|uniref:Plasmid replication, integration and excision activator n=1 Tax=Actinosynnema mirum (strain ATCC 29888 / DSM 43827 / JCM 3225 / NBRC 14064 / NCIMB 13271 / NRRL B-12336 / IMRU 3971 / 101) TaxID=446462 RepID=C6WJ84_ACTMD|nr:hypothetical protein [Actinosynnema mirum]ACU40160.1 hypothetical protein Amir_6359 [Actinosynnema mirum DSM 43827]